MTAQKVQIVLLNVRRCLELLEENAEQTEALITAYRALMRGKLEPQQLMEQLDLLDRIGVTETK